MRTIRIWVFWVFPANANENHSHLTFSNFWRGGACAKVKYFFECYLEMCDRFGNQGHSLFSAKEKKFFNNSADQRQCECENDCS